MLSVFEILLGRSLRRLQDFIVTQSERFKIMKVYFLFGLAALPWRDALGHLTVDLSTMVRSNFYFKSCFSL